jgi:thioredoxin 1
MPVVHLTNKNFKHVAIDSQKPVLIDFWAEWCAPCRRQSSIIEQLADELDGTAIVAKLDVDANPELAGQFSVMSIPTLVTMKAGKIVGSKTGVTSREELLKMISSAK